MPLLARDAEMDNHLSKMLTAWKNKYILIMIVIKLGSEEIKTSDESKSIIF